MPKNSKDEVSDRQSLSYEIAQELMKRGYLIANSAGERINEPREYVIGILEPKEKTLSFESKENQRAFYIGNLWLSNKYLGAEPYKRWVVEAYGRDSIAKLTRIIWEIAKPRGISIEVTLESEYPREETVISNYELNHLLR